MKSFKKFLNDLHPYVLSSVAGVLTVAQLILVFFLPGLDSLALEWAGWICLWTSGIFGMLPIITFHKKGGVPEGESYIKTSVLVNTGIYAIVRHPQGGTAFLLINLGLMLISQHWISVGLGLVSMALAYADTFKMDQSCVAKFGDTYSSYIENVPRANFIVGLFRLIKHSAKRSGG